MASTSSQVQQQKQQQPTISIDPGNEPTKSPPPQELPQLVGQSSSIYSLTLDEFQHAVCEPGKSFGSMNMDEFLTNIRNAKESQAASLLPCRKQPLQPRLSASTDLTVTPVASPDKALSRSLHLYAGGPWRRSGLKYIEASNNSSNCSSWSSMAGFGNMMASGFHYPEPRNTANVAMVPAFQGYPTQQQVGGGAERFSNFGGSGASRNGGGFPGGGYGGRMGNVVFDVGAAQQQLSPVS